jgi:hypothetical protein
MSIGSAIKNVFSSKCVCENRDVCDCYEDASYVCNQEYDKSYCGIWRQFNRREIKEYRKDW